MLRTIAAIFLALPPAALLAQAESVAPAPVPADTKQQDKSYLRSIDDIDVETADGRTLGEIEDVLIDTDGNPVSFAVEMGGFLGVGDYEVAVPIDAFTYRDGVYVSKMNEEQLSNLPRWDD